MLKLWHWLLHGEDVGKRLALVVVSVANVAVALGEWPVTPIDKVRVLAQLAVAAATAAMSKPTNGYAKSEPS